jgi:diguanylate cyclase (GGDEF)-like protein
LQSTASIGIARIPEDGTTLDEVLGRADAAMYRAKARGGNRVEFNSN